VPKVTTPSLEPDGDDVLALEAVGLDEVMLGIENGRRGACPNIE
jgi:hypothetical protein